MSLTPDDIKAIADAVHKELANSTAFHIDPEKHYQQHQEMAKVLQAFNAAQGSFWRWAFAGILGMFVGLAALYFKFQSKG